MTDEPWPPRYLTVTEAAAAMSRRRQAVLRLIHSGQLKSIRLGRSYRIRETEALCQGAVGLAAPEDGMLDAAQCARILRCPEATINALVWHGHLADQGDTPSGSCRIPVSEFRRFLRDTER